MNAGTEKRQSNDSAVIKQSPSSSSKVTRNNTLLHYAGTKAPHPGGGWNDDVDPLDSSQLKFGVC